MPPTEVPASEPLPTWANCGVRRVKSVRLRVMVGSRSICSVETFVPVPMVEDDRMPVSAETVASPSEAAASVSVTSTV